MPLNSDTLRSQISVLSNSSSTQTGTNLPRLGGERGVTSPPPPPPPRNCFFKNVLCNAERYRNKNWWFFQKFYGKHFDIYLGVSADRLLLWQQGFPIFAKKHKMCHSNASYWPRNCFLKYNITFVCTCENTWLKQHANIVLNYGKFLKRGIV